MKSCHFNHAAVSVKISNLLICSHSFDLFCPMFEKEKENFILTIVILYLLVVLNSI